jgi:hypothetical protein
MEQFAPVFYEVLKQAPLAALFGFLWWRATKRADRLEAKVIECLERAAHIALTDKPELSP